MAKIRTGAERKADRAANAKKARQAVREDTAAAVKKAGGRETLGGQGVKNLRLLHREQAGLSSTGEA